MVKGQKKNSQPTKVDYSVLVYKPTKHANVQYLVYQHCPIFSTIFLTEGGQA